jgi:hypothetical protein
MSEGLCEIRSFEVAYTYLARGGRINIGALAVYVNDVSACGARIARVAYPLSTPNMQLQLAQGGDHVHGQ